MNRKRWNKYVFLVCILTLLSVVGTGCQGNSSVASRAIVQTIGIDYDEKEQGFLVSLQYFATKGSGSQQAIDLSKVNAKVATGSGKTVTEAIENAIFPEGKTPFYAQSSYIILGKSLVEHGVQDVVDYINLDRDLRVNTVILIAEDKASDIVSEDVDEGILPSDKITQMSGVMISNGKMREVPYFKFASMYYNEYESVLVPVIKAESKEPAGGSSGGEEESGSQYSKKLSFSGTEIIKDAKGVRQLNEKETRGCLWLSDEIPFTSVSTEFNDDILISVDVVQTSTNIDPVVDGEQITFYVSIENQLVIREYRTKKFENLTEEDYQIISQSVENVIREECESAIEASMKLSNADVLHFGRRLRQKYPDLEKQLPDHWEEEWVDDINVKISVDNKFSRL